MSLFDTHLEEMPNPSLVYANYTGTNDDREMP